MTEEKKRSQGMTIWLNELQYQKLHDVEADFADVFGRDLTHGEAIMAAALISKAFISLFELGAEALDPEKLDFNRLIDFEHLQKAGAHVPRDTLARIGPQIERAFIQLDALGFLKPRTRSGDIG